MTGQMILWAVLLVVFTLAESGTMQLVSIWFAAGALAAFITSIFKIPFWAQIAVFLVVSIVLLVLTRPILKKFMKGRYVPTNLELDIGKYGIVTEEINNLGGRVRVDGVNWNASSEDGSVIPAGEKIVVRKINGTSFIVAAVKNEQPQPQG